MKAFDRDNLEQKTHSIEKKGLSVKIYSKVISERMIIGKKRFF